MTQVKAIKFLQECASIAHGSGVLEGTSGGKGNIGYLNGHVVKFRTHIGERRGEITEDMAACSQRLRNKMAEALDALKVDPDLQSQILDNDFKLGKWDAEGSAGAHQKSLLDRKVVASVIKKIEVAKGMPIFDSTDGVYKSLSSKGVDTTFASVTARSVERRANELSDGVIEKAENADSSSVEGTLRVVKSLSRLMNFVVDNFDSYFKEFFPKTVLPSELDVQGLKNKFESYSESLEKATVLKTKLSGNVVRSLRDDFIAAALSKMQKEADSRGVDLKVFNAVDSAMDLFLKCDLRVMTSEVPREKVPVGEKRRVPLRARYDEDDLDISAEIE